MPVVDASVLVELLCETDQAEAVEERLAVEEHSLWAPHLVDAEVGQALRRAVRLGRMEAEEAGEAIWQIEELAIRRVEHELLVHVAWDLRDNFSFYDALYVALALMLDEPLLTFDARLARSGFDLPIEVLA
ncbi:MAG TPA: type II toxin-antitoxin system VapC family toxin [Solirubrobacterales bacterium]|jgi:predicted nucleic acid-binding protein|nr:type II toxin-antitoxin system VapC family toxin [Solirubrobacterales bacterium]